MTDTDTENSNSEFGIFTSQNSSQFSVIFNSQTSVVPIIKIQSDGKVFWHGQEVTGNDDFRKAMIDLKDLLSQIFR